MKRLFQTNINATAASLMLFILRAGVAVFMLTHGLPKLSKLLDGNTGFADPIGIGEMPSLLLTVFAEVVCSFLLLIGLASRLAAVPLIITMTVAAFYAHADDPFASKEKALLYLICYLVILVMGSGKYSVDKLISK